MPQMTTSIATGLAKLRTSSHPPSAAPRFSKLSPRQLSSSARRNLWFILAQFAPMAVLSYVFIQVNPVLEATRVGSMRVFEIMVIASVISPLVSQTISGPIFRAYDRLRVRDRATIAKTTLYALPKALLVGAPTLVLVVGMAGVVRHWSREDFLIVLAAVGANVCFAATLTPAYARRSPGMLVAGWLTYAWVLWLFPQAWYAPPLVAAVVLVGVSVRLSRDAVEVSRVSVWQSVIGLIRSLADAVPLWIVPMTVYLYGIPVTMTMLLLFVALMPALITYQVYFVSMSDPTWRSIDRFKDSITLSSYAAVNAEGIRLRRMSVAGTAGAFAMAVTTTVLITPWLMGSVPSLGKLLMSVALAAVAAVVLLAQINRLAMTGTELVRYAVPLALLAAIAIALIIGAALTQVLMIYALACVVLSGAVAFVNRMMWRTPEYTLFWAKAIRQ